MASSPISKKPRLICLMGPTASGKTDLAIALAQERNCELISVDSALVYRGMDIGSAKPDYPHHLVDICDPAEPYSAANFVTDANRAIEDISGRGKTPLLVGGTMLYFKALLEGLSEMPAADPQVRADIAAAAQEDGWPAVHAQLQAVDPQAAARIHPNHSQRISRALEVYRVSGVSMTQWQSSAGAAGVLAGYDVTQLVICPAQRAVLHDRIARRFALMMEAGFLQEVAVLRSRPGMHSALPAARAVGYRQLWQHLDGDVSLDEAIANGIAATRQLAKRQLTWLRKWPDLAWINTDEDGNLLAQPGSDENRAQPADCPLSLALNYLDRPPL